MILLRLIILGAALLLSARAGAGAPPADREDACFPDVRDVSLLYSEGLRIQEQAGRLRGPDRDQAYERALRCFLLVLEVSKSPELAKVYHPVGLIYEKLDRPVEAIAALERYLAEVPESRRWPGATGQVRERLRRLREQVA